LAFRVGLVSQPMGQEAVVPPGPQALVDLSPLIGIRDPHPCTPTSLKRPVQKFRQYLVQSRPLQMIEPDLAGHLRHVDQLS
jgi:hypothetical protein